MDSTQPRRTRKTQPAHLRKVGRGWTALPNALLQDAGLSYRARGVLAYLLSMPEGWDVRADAVAAGSPGEKLAAVRRALRELGAAGYYRIVRRSRLNAQGKRVWITETWVSRDPSPEWRAEWGTRQGRPVVLRHVDGAPLEGAPASPAPAGFESGWQPGRDASPAPAGGPGRPGFCPHPDHEFQRLTAAGTCPLCAADAIADPTL